MDLNNPWQFAIFFIVLWCSISLLLSWIGGWAELARAYRAPGPFSGIKLYLRDGVTRFGTSYGRCLTVGANSEGLYLAIVFLFRVGHPPLFIPWRDISIRPTRFFFVRYYEFEIRQAPSVRVRLRKRTGEEVKEAAGSAWAGDRGIAGAAF